MSTREVPGATGSPAPTAPTRPSAPESPVAISIVHASLDLATFALMIGTFVDEPMTGVERFVDRQLGGLLSTWIELDRYPGELGTSRFVEPAPVGSPATEPPGCYVVGLGRSSDFGRVQLAHAVRACLIDRCLPLYSPVDGLAAEHQVRVGVSSTLLGVGVEDDVRVEDSVAGIVDGVLRVNDDLAQYEASRSIPVSVRIGALELVERYAERANLAAVALRSLATKVRLRGGYETLRTTTVVRRAGGLPLGASLVEISQRWRRFLITDGSADTAGAGDDRSLALDVTLLGRDARADRVRHHVDAATVHALVDHLGADPADRTTARTLYEQLVPKSIEGEFETSAAVQFVVDAVTANLPWELLTLPQTRGAAVPAECGTVMRQFAERDDRRLNPDRASVGGALVIAAGRVPGLPPLPGVFDEADHVARLLGGALGEAHVARIDDSDVEIEVVALQNALFGDHQFLHIASHGVYEADRPGRTGAVLSTTNMLTVDHVRELTRVPDVVFLNCCSLGRIGMSRMAAGLAREFMAIGTRAVVAAGWSVDDAAAQAFAVTFYQELLGGRPLGDAVARARLACAQAGGGQTWAAYQCYGDPGFVVRGHRPTVDLAGPDPVSDTDLVARLDTLAVRTGDLGLAGRGPVSDGHARLSAVWTALRDWVVQRPGEADETVRRRLGAIARDLGDFRAAADHFGALVVERGDGAPRVGLLTRTTRPADLQQAANCLARAAQREARRQGDGYDAAIDDLELATQIAQAAVDVLPEGESYAVLGSVLRRRATIDREHRPELLQQARDAYARGAAVGNADDQRYPGENARQLGLLVDGDSPPPAVDPPPVPAAGEAGDVTLVDQRPPPPADFWARAQPGDAAVTDVLGATDDEQRQRAAARASAEYRRAFAARSTWAQRRSVLDHLGDLRDLVPPADGRGPALATVIAALSGWDDDLRT